MRLYIPPKRQRGILLSKFIRDIVNDVFRALVAELELGFFFGRDDDVPDDCVVKFVFAAWVGRSEVGKDLLCVPVEEGFQISFKIEFYIRLLSWLGGVVLVLTAFDYLYIPNINLHAPHLLLQNNTRRRNQKPNHKGYCCEEPKEVLDSYEGGVHCFLCFYWTVSFVLSLVSLSFIQNALISDLYDMDG